MSLIKKVLLSTLAFLFASATLFLMAGKLEAKTITIRIASGHPPTVVYAGLMKSFFQPELKKAIESKTSHKVKFIEGYSGSIVKVFDTFEGIQNGIVDVGGFCFCFVCCAVDTWEQAWARASEAKGNKGREFAKSTLHMINLYRQNLK